MVEFYENDEVIAWYATVVSLFFLVLPVCVPWLRSPPVWVRRISLSGPLLVFLYSLFRDQAGKSSEDATLYAWLAAVAFLLPWLLLNCLRGFFSSARIGWLMGASYGSVLWGFSASAVYLAVRPHTESYQVILLVIGITAAFSLALGVLSYQSSATREVDLESSVGLARVTYDVVSRACSAALFAFYSVLGIRELVNNDPDMVLQMNQPGEAFWYSIIVLTITLHLYFVSLQTVYTEYEKVGSVRRAIVQAATSTEVPGYGEGEVTLY